MIAQNLDIGRLAAHMSIDLSCRIFVGYFLPLEGVHMLARELVGPGAIVLVVGLVIDGWIASNLWDFSVGLIVSHAEAVAARSVFILVVMSSLAILLELLVLEVVIRSSMLGHWSWLGCRHSNRVVAKYWWIALALHQRLLLRGTILHSNKAETLRVASWSADHYQEKGQLEVS